MKAEQTRCPAGSRASMGRGNLAGNRPEVSATMPAQATGSADAWAGSRIRVLHVDGPERVAARLQGVQAGSRFV